MSRRVFLALIAVVALAPARRTSFGPMVAQAQELKDELDALEDIPPDDLAGLGKDGKKKDAPKADTAATPPPTAPAPKDALDDLDTLPTETPSATASVPGKNDAVPVDDAVESLGSNGDVGLESELKSLDDREKPNFSPPVAALTGVESEPVGRVTNMEFRQMPDRVRLVLKGNRVADFSRELRSKRKQVIVEMKNMTIGKGVLKRALDTGEFDGPVALVQAFEAKAGSMPVVKVLFQLRNFTDPAIMKSGNDLIVDFPILSDNTLFKNRTAERVQIPETFMSLTTKMPSVGQKISLSVKDAEVQDILNFLSKASGKNFVLVPGTGAAKVTLNVRATPWDEVLRIVLVNAKLGYQKIGNVFRIAPLDELRKELDDIAASSKKQEDLIPLETRLFALSYAKASIVVRALDDFKTQSRGKVSVDERTNSVVMTDVPEILEKVARYLKSIDRQTAQVLIEGRIVEASKSFVQSLNMQFNLRKRGGPFNASALNIGTTDANIQNRFLPTIASLGSFGSIAAFIGAQEKEDSARTIASPRTLALDNQPAVIQQGESIPIVTPATATTPSSVNFVDAVLRLSVTPQVTTDGYVFMNIELQRDTPIQGASAGAKTTRSVKTQALVESGKTVVLGGIYISDRSENIIGFPWLRTLPIFGALFRGSNVSSENTKELLMFISPKVLNPDRAFLMNADKEEEDERQGPITSQAAENVPDDLF